MAITYDYLAGTTFSSTTTTVSFTGISQSYTDLRVVVYTANFLGAGGDWIMRMNNDSTSGNYAELALAVQGTTPTAGFAYKNVTLNSIRLNGDIAYTATTNGTAITIAEIFNYKDTTTRKNVLIRTGSQLTGNSSQGVGVCTAVWNSTSAINQLDFTFHTGATAGTKVAIFGILKA